MYQKPKGTRDIVYPKIRLWQAMESAARAVAGLYNFQEIRTPTFEDAALYQRSVGDSSDIVNKEMYIFEDRSGRKLALRPEGTAGVVRAVVENGMLNEALPIKSFYLANNFRYENPQAGRYREHSQFGIECFGASEPGMECEIIMLAVQFLSKLGVKDYSILINSIGCSTCRAEFNAALSEYARKNESELCQDCRRRMETNPMRMLDCKNSECHKILDRGPKISDYLCPDCKNHFDTLIQLLDEMKVKYTIEPKLVRGFDYYTKTVFEFQAAGFDGKTLAIGGGGRYDNLIKEIGGPDTPAVGAGIGLDRVVHLLTEDVLSQPELIFLANAGTVEIKTTQIMAQTMRGNGIACEFNSMGRSLKAQLKYADKIGAEYLVVVGDEELKTNEFTLKNLRGGDSCKITRAKLLGIEE